MSVIDYTNEYSNLPFQPMTRHNFENVTNSIASIINQVKELQAQGKYAEAASIVEAQDLKKYTLSSEYINGIDEETRNLEIMCKSKKQSVYYMDDEPGFGAAGDVWISGEEIY